MSTIKLPAVLRQQANGERAIEVEAGTIGVPPIDSIRPSNLAARAATGAATSTSRDRRQEPDLVARLDRR